MHELPELEPRELARYARHVSLPELGERGQRRLKAGSVLLVGAGGLGSPAALYLAAPPPPPLRIVDFDRPDKLEQIGGGYFQATPETRETPTEAVIYQSTLETSNVAGVEELVNMINVQRSFESATQMMKMVDESYKRLNQAR